MARNSIQFQKGLSLLDFQRLYGTEELCVAALERAWGSHGFVGRSQGYSGVILGVETNCCS